MTGFGRRNEHVGTSQLVGSIARSLHTTRTNPELASRRAGQSRARGGKHAAERQCDSGPHTIQAVQVRNIAI